jgi:flagellum-specific peptidoglycan hydrolase FlgJ
MSFVGAGSDPESEADQIALAEAKRKAREGGGGGGKPSTAGMPASKAAFIDKAWPLAVKASQQTGVAPEVILAQAGLESNWGRSAPNNNYFGIKGKGGSFQTQEFVNGRMVTMNQSFAGYGSMEESFQGYADFINRNKRYAALKQGGSLEAQTAALQASGYATDPNYGGKVLGIARGIRTAHVGNTQQQLAMNDNRGGGGGQTVNVNGPIVVHTQATDAHGVARGIHSALRNVAQSSNTGLA